jgi:membrane associated rhomboid family serine protease
MQRGYQGGGMSFGPPFTPSVIKNLIIANVVIFAFFGFFPGLGKFHELLMVKPSEFWTQGMLWQPFTYMWLHGGLMHCAFNMFALWMFGTPLALIWGAKRFLRYYLLCGTGAGLIIATAPYFVAAMIPEKQLMVDMNTLGASGAVMGVLLGYCLTWPDRTIMLLIPPIPIKAIWLLPLLFFMEFSMGPPNVSHSGHLGGVFVGWLLLRRDGHTGGFLPSWKRIKFLHQRYKMRKRLRDASRDRYRSN